MKRHEKLLTEALEKLEEEQLAALPNDLPEHAFSPEFEAKVQKLRKTRKRTLVPLWNTVAKRVAVVVLALLTASTVTVLSVKALRDPVFQFLGEVVEKIGFPSSDWGGSVIEPVPSTTATSPSTPSPIPSTAPTSSIHLPQSLPAGYALDRQEGNNYVYTDQSGGEFLYSQRSSGGAIPPDAISIAVRDNAGWYYENDNVNYLQWTDGGYHYTLASKTLDRAVLQTIAESVGVW